MQAAGGSTTIATARDIVKTEGVRGLYRGGLPLVLGGALYVATFMLIPNLEFIVYCIGCHCKSLQTCQ